MLKKLAQKLTGTSNNVVQPQGVCFGVCNCTTAQGITGTTCQYGNGTWYCADAC